MLPKHNPPMKVASNTPNETALEPIRLQQLVPNDFVDQRKNRCRQIRLATTEEREIPLLAGHPQSNLESSARSTSSARADQWHSSIAAHSRKELSGRWTSEFRGSFATKQNFFWKAMRFWLLSSGPAGSCPSSYRRHLRTCISPTPRPCALFPRSSLGGVAMANSQAESGISYRWQFGHGGSREIGVSSGCLPRLLRFPDYWENGAP